MNAPREALGVCQKVVQGRWDTLDAGRLFPFALVAAGRFPHSIRTRGTARTRRREEWSNNTPRSDA